MVRKLLVIFMVFILLLSGCEKKVTEIPKLKEPVGADIDTAVVTRGDIYKLTTYDSKVYPDTQEACFTVDGQLKDIAVSMGQEVKKGDLLISLNDENLQTQLTQLEDGLKDAKINNDYSNQLQDLDIQLLKLDIEQKKESKASAIDIAKAEADLTKKELTRQQDLQLQELTLLKTQKKIDEIKAELVKYKLTAPSSGKVVFIKYVNIGARVSAYDTMVIIADDSKLHLQSEIISQGDINNASQVYALINGKDYEIEYIPLEADELLKIKNGETNIESRFKIEGASGVASGDYACICIKDNLKENVLTIPIKALYKDAQGSFVYRIEDGKRVRCNVEVGTETDIQIEITSGLAEGDVVYVQGL